MVKVKTGSDAQFHDHIMQSMAEGVLVLDKKGIITYTNQVVAGMFGYEEETLLGADYRDFWPEAKLIPQNPNKDTHYLQTTLRRRDGRAIAVIITITPIAAQTATHKLVSIIRMDDVERLNEVLTFMQRLAGIGTLTSSVAHELTNPISIITATCSNLQHDLGKESVDTAELLSYIQMIEQSAWRCTRIIEVLRNYTLNEEPQMAVTDLNMIIEYSLTLVQNQLRKEFNVAVETELASDLKSIVCDHNRITQVLINLLTNARDAMQPNGGTIHIKSWPIPASAALPTPNGVKPLPEEDRQELQAFSVRDFGHGIAPEFMDKIFDPFFTTKPKGVGMGLGLFVTKRIVAQHNGRIWAENNDDGGATFTVLLPRRI